MNVNEFYISSICDVRGYRMNDITQSTVKCELIKSAQMIHLIYVIWLFLFVLFVYYLNVNEIGVSYNILRNYYEKRYCMSVEIVNLEITYYNDLQWLQVVL